ncbi:hypothetical protein ACFVFQ_14155 [Streptomyces sp. NPDC057743]|uniref:hypothetical protein n=1 Tax=Streptomyces sp. NPDC057743 TaxID=3346236 RepID=UPI0036989519
MLKTIRRAVLPALAATSLLVITGCSQGSSDTPTDGKGDGKDSSITAESADADAPLAVAAAPTDAASPTGSGAPSAVAKPGTGGRPAAKSSLKIVTFDAKSGRAVIAGPAGSTPSKGTGETGGGHGNRDAERGNRDDGHGKEQGEGQGKGKDQGEGPEEGQGKTPTPKPSTSQPATSKPPAPVAVGDVFASAPVAGAPRGALAKVTEVVGKTEQGTEVKTTPATLGALLGGSTAKGRIPVDPSTMKVEPIAPNVQVSWAKTGTVRFGPQGAHLPLGNLRLDVRAALPTAQTPAGTAAASASGFVQLKPEVDFSYDGKGTTTGTPGTASVGLTGNWASQWELKGQAAGGKSLRLPFAKLHSDPVVWIGGVVPVVVNLDLTCYLHIDADGKASVDVKQDIKGHFQVGGSYSRAKGWAPVAQADMHGTPLTATATAAGKVKAALGAEASVGLYGTVGVTGRLAPYLRAEVTGTATGTSNGTGSLVGKWAAYGGVDLSGDLWAHLNIFGTPLFERSIPLGPLNHEWKLAGGEGAVRTPTKRP